MTAVQLGLIGLGKTGGSMRERIRRAGVYTDRDVFARIYREDYGQRCLTEAGEDEERVIDCARDIREYILRAHGRFPARTDAIHVPGGWLQVHHVENEYDERFFTNGSSRTVSRTRTGPTPRPGLTSRLWRRSGSGRTTRPDHRC